MRFVDYLKFKRTAIAVFVIFAAILFSCPALYGVSPKLLCYPLLLCVLVGVVFLVVGYRRYRRAYDELELISKLRSELIDLLPEPHSPQATQYQAIIRALCAEDRRRQAELAGKYNDMIDYYTAWAHQIKTPIAAMKLSCQNEDSDLARQSLTDLKRIEQYVDMVLTYLKLDAGDIDYVIREHDIDAIIRQAIRSFAGEFINRGIKLEYDPIHCEVLTDDKWLTFVLEQVISNALKYTPEGTIRIEPDGTKLCIRDTGIGIDAADIPRIFEKGFTGYNGRRDKRATGIGLYLCKRICDNLSHDITVESTVGVGTTIRIDLKRNTVGIE